MKSRVVVGLCGLVTMSSLVLMGCQSNPVVIGGVPVISGEQGNVAMVDPKSRTHLQTSLTMGDYLALSETVTNKMLSSKFVQSWGSKRPRLIVGILVNNTDDEGIRMTDLHDRIQETILNSGLARVVDKSATSFEYIIKSELTSTRQYGEGGKEFVHYTLQLKMFKLSGELTGQWSDDLAMAKAGKSLF